MKLILTQEVTGLGGPGDVVEVKDGYGRNYLVPQGVAIRWTRGGEKTVESIKAARSSRAVRDLGHAEEVKAKIEGQTVHMSQIFNWFGKDFGEGSKAAHLKWIKRHAPEEIAAKVSLDMKVEYLNWGWALNERKR